MTCTPLKGKRKQEGYETNPEEIIDSKRLSVSLNAALSELSPRSREIVVAHNYRETTFTSLATQFGISVERVKQLYKIAMEQLKESLSDVHGK